MHTKVLGAGAVNVAGTGQAHARPHLGSRNPSSGEKARRYLRGAGLACLEGIRKEDKAVQV